MKKLIELDAAIEALKRAEALSRAFGYHAVIDAVEALPPVDAVPVQRCDGCRYADWHSNGCIAYCTKHGTDGHVADSFCSEGEKDGGDEQTQKVE